MATTPTTARYAVSGEIRAGLARSNRKQADLAACLGISQPQVSARLRGQVAWTVDELVAVAEFLGVTPGSLLDAA